MENKYDKGKYKAFYNYWNGRALVYLHARDYHKFGLCSIMHKLSHGDVQQLYSLYQKIDNLLDGGVTEAVSRVCEYGANKYQYKGYLNVEFDRYLHALGRHLDAYLGGEEDDTESGMAHLAHAASNILILLELMYDGHSSEILNIKESTQ